MRYSLAYDPFHNLESIGIDGLTSPLIRYEYKKGTQRVKAITYANGNTVRLSYNSYGQTVSEKWFASPDATVPTAYYKYGYDRNGNLSKSIDILSAMEYNFFTRMQWQSQDIPTMLGALARCFPTPRAVIFPL